MLAGPKSENGHCLVFSISERSECHQLGPAVPCLGSQEREMKGELADPLWRRRLQDPLWVPPAGL